MIALFCLYTKLLFASWRQKRRRLSSNTSIVLSNFTSRQNSVKSCQTIEEDISCDYVRTVSSDYSMGNVGQPEVSCFNVMDWFKNARYVFFMLGALLFSWIPYAIFFFYEIAYHRLGTYTNNVSVNV